MDALDHVRRLVPVAAVPALVERSTARAWADPAMRAAAEAAMEFLVGATERADEVPELARAHVHQMTLRAWMRWHPRAITRQEIRDVEWLTTRRDPSRGVLLSFMHHNRYEGMFPSLRRAGVVQKTVITPEFTAPGAPAAYRQHHKVAAMGGEMLMSTLGSDGLADELRRGTIVSLATDVAGRTPMTFLGRKVMGSFGAARLASLTDSPVVVVTVHRTATSHHIQVHEPLEPTDFAGPEQLLDAMLAIHEPAILAWPEAVDSPFSRFGRVEDA